MNRRTPSRGCRAAATQPHTMKVVTSQQYMATTNCPHRDHEGKQRRHDANAYGQSPVWPQLVAPKDNAVERHEEPEGQK
jgi:hypothetical protein